MIRMLENRSKIMFENWQCGRFSLDLSETKIMGVLNCTPDSFSDGGNFLCPNNALRQAEKMIEEGVDIIDVGAESTRPGAIAIPVEEEIRRLTPVVTALVKEAARPISIDTKNAITMRVMLDIGADMINDVHGLEDKKAIATVANSHCGICVMHMRGMPINMQNNTEYTDLISEIEQYLQGRIEECLQAGIDENRLIIDPGFGFGKTPEQNMMLVKHANEFIKGAYPILIGASRKSTIGYYLGGREINDRIVGSVTVAAIAAYLGTHIVRVHDVKETKDALLMIKALKNVK